MSEQVVEYLYFSKTETPENISDILSETLSPYTIDSKSILIQKNKNLTINFNINTYNNSLHVLFKYKKPFQISLQEVTIFQDFLDEINIELSEGQGKIFIQVKDNGIGIDKKYHKHLFKKFYRVPTGNIHNVKGFGLGLNYVQSITKSHFGNVSFSSEISKGTIFTLSFPSNR